MQISKDSSETKKTTTIVPLKDVSQLIDDPSNRKLSALKIKTNPPMNNKNTAKDKALNLTNQSFINENKILNLNNNNTMKEKNAISTNKIINPNEISHSLKGVYNVLNLTDIFKTKLFLKIFILCFFFYCLRSIDKLKHQCIFSKID